ncbi:TIGR04222 domain-containing membrane protein [Saccharopolyspora terrae]|nr:TIGR04222 domain-containing membrane protein [Saccharopolyspora terrae]
MDQPWGLSGPEFLVLYGGVLVAWCVIVVLFRAKVKAQRSPADVAHVPDVYERAFLNGGSDRVADTALAGLVDNGRVRINRRHKLQRIDIGDEDEVQRHVWSLIDRRGRLDRLRKAFRRSGYCGSMQQRLIDHGLLVPPGAQTALRVLVWGFPLLALIAVVRGVNGLRLGHPVGFLVLELGVTVTAWAFARGSCGHPLRTRAGDAMRKQTSPNTHENRGAHAALGLGPVVAASAAELVAQGGLGAHPDPTIARLLRTAGSGGGSGSSGSSCGGGGGGCGGGGGG